MKALLRASLASLVGSAALFASSAAFAAGEACLNDTDCPGAECGGDVCNWNLTNPNGTADKPYTCNPAGTDPKGHDGWCSDDDDNFCKCKAQGATCGTNVFYCSFTKPSDAPAGGGGSGSGSGGTGSSTAGTSASTAGTTASTAGTTASTAGTGPSAGGSGSTAPPAAAADEGGCSVSAPGRSNVGLALGAFAALGLALSRRRR